ncbi:hypothetical protein PLICRDRAFT_544324 [Plicaturopsis crispa FD-325 SS-3]|nr:hypothetical protein PLICRDRAFT_544324 [Plicaturopsis crispa FD-325 SS-3]
MSTDPSTPISILILGTGELGLSVLIALAKSRRTSETISVLLRPSSIASTDPAKARDIAHIRGLGVNVVPGDIAAASVDALAQIFSAYHTIIGCTGFVSGRGTQVKLAEAVLRAGVPRYVPWQFGVDYDVIGRGSPQDLFDEQLDVRDLLRAQTRTAWLIISTGVFTEFLFSPAFGIVDAQKPAVRALGSLENRITITTAADIGRLTAEILRVEPPIVNRVVYTAGDTVSYGELADIVQEVTGREVVREVRDVEELAKQLKEDPGDALKKYALTFALGQGVAWPVETSFNALAGIPVVRAREWAKAMEQAELN